MACQPSPGPNTAQDLSGAAPKRISEGSGMVEPEARRRPTVRRCYISTDVLSIPEHVVVRVGTVAPQAEPGHAGAPRSGVASCRRRSPGCGSDKLCPSPAICASRIATSVLRHQSDAHNAGSEGGCRVQIVVCQAEQ